MERAFGGRSAGVMRLGRWWAAGGLLGDGVQRAGRRHTLCGWQAAGVEGCPCGLVGRASWAVRGMAGGLAAVVVAGDGGRGGLGQIDGSPIGDGGAQDAGGVRAAALPATCCAVGSALRWTACVEGGCGERRGRCALHSPVGRHTAREGWELQGACGMRRMIRLARRSTKTG